MREIDRQRIYFEEQLDRAVAEKKEALDLVESLGTYLSLILDGGYQLAKKFWRDRKR